ncbi:unnamed protein product [Fusarium equiseti]|uniref:Uncharacterized protein n=1 Tax=Fusarium equiseti TaxID=61235 RepID=A0A8J2IN60_FUSEQ|nr:unnamed protein product [Fusarium equiseti]
MPKGATSYNRERFRSQPYGSRSVQSGQQSTFGGPSANNSEDRSSTVQPVDEVAPEAPNNDTGEHTYESAHLDWQPIPPTNAPIPDVEPLDLPAPTEPEAYLVDLDGTDECMVAFNRALPPGPKHLLVTPGEKPDAPGNIPVNTGPSEPPRGPRSFRSRYDSYRPRELKMVNSMLLHRGGGVQDNVFTKVPSASKTISFRVDSEETLLQAYRHVKAMNPSAPVGGILFSVPPKTEKNEFLFTEVNNIRWNALTGRQNPQLPPGWKFFRNNDGGFTMHAGM